MDGALPIFNPLNLLLARACQCWVCVSPFLVRNSFTRLIISSRFLSLVSYRSSSGRGKGDLIKSSWLSKTWQRHWAAPEATALFQASMRESGAPIFWAKALRRLG